jgi:hypothetical protein
MASRSRSGLVDAVAITGADTPETFGSSVVDRERFLLLIRRFELSMAAPPARMTLVQRGAGNGKTYESLTWLDKFEHKKIFIYVTKQHAAKDVIEQKLRMKEPELEKFVPFDDETFKTSSDGKKYYAVLRRPSGETVQVFILTVDAFLFALCDEAGQKQARRDSEFFEGICRAIEQGHCRLKGLANTVQLCGRTVALNRFVELVVDESQDLGAPYARALFVILWKTHIDVHLIGDELQSIGSDDNLFVQLRRSSVHGVFAGLSVVRGSSEAADLVQVDEGTNVVRRWKSQTLTSRINKAVRFEHFELPPIRLPPETSVTAPEGDESSIVDEVTTPADPNFGVIKFGRDATVEERAQEVMSEVTRLFENEDAVPHDFLFIFPVLRERNLAFVLEMKLNEFWNERLQELSKRVDSLLRKVEDSLRQDVSEDERKRLESEMRRLEDWKRSLRSTTVRPLCILHHAESRGPVRLGDSRFASQIMTIHSSKGHGRRYVFLLELTKKGLDVHSRGRELVYESLLHVALTRMTYRLIFCYGEEQRDDVTRRLGLTASIDTETLEELGRELSLRWYVNDMLRDMITEEEGAFVNLWNLSERGTETVDRLRDPAIEHVDWGHHVVRRCVMFYIVIRCLLQKFNLEDSVDGVRSTWQLFLSFRDLSKMVIVEVYNVREYWSILWEIRRTPANNRKPSLKLPIYKYKNESEDQKSCRRYLRDLYLSAKDKFKNEKQGQLPELCVAEICVLIHFLWVSSSRVAYSVCDLTQPLLHTILAALLRQSNDLSEHSLTYACPCGQHHRRYWSGRNEAESFAEVDAIAESIANHHVMSQQLSKTVDELKPLLAPSTVFNMLPSIEMGRSILNPRKTSSDLHIHTNVAILGRGARKICGDGEEICDDEEEICDEKCLQREMYSLLIEPNVSNLNVHGLMLRAFLETSVCACSDEDRWRDRAGSVVFLTLNSGKPLLVDVPRVTPGFYDALRTVVRRRLEKLHTRVIQYVRAAEFPEDCHDAITKLLDKAQNKGEDGHHDSYLRQNLISLKVQLENLEDGDDEASYLADSMRKFEGALRKKLEETLHHFFSTSTQDVPTERPSKRARTENKVG